MSASASRPIEPPARAELSDPELRKVLRVMALGRAVDERCMNLQRQGRIGFYVPMEGQEGAQVGCAWALEKKDWICPAYREMGVALVRGIPLSLLLAQLYGTSADVSKGRQMPNHYGFAKDRFVSASSPIGTQIIQAVGLAYASRFKGEKVVSVPFFGDGATSSNDFHSGMNFAGVTHAPVIFFCQNNQWAISLPRAKQTHSETIAIKASAYGFPGIQVDGNDFHAVYSAVKAARARAVAGEGPTLIEAVTYRMGPHSTSDDPRRYRSPQELAAWKARDPLERLKTELVSRGVLSEPDFEALQEEVRAQVQQEIQAAEQVGPPAPTSIFDDVWSSPPPNLQEQRREFEELLKEGVIKP